jgi:hypothetical protein
LAICEEMDAFIRIHMGAYGDSATRRAALGISKIKMPYHNNQQLYFKISILEMLSHVTCIFPAALFVKEKTESQ